MRCGYAFASPAKHTRCKHLRVRGLHRTPDPCLLLCKAGSGSKPVVSTKENTPLVAGYFLWWALRDSNPRPSRCKRDALAN